MSAGLAISLDESALSQLAGALADRVVERVEARLTDEAPWMNSVEAVEYLRLPSLDALHRLTGSNAIPHVKQGGRCLFNRRELDAWLESRHEGPRLAVA